MKRLIVLLLLIWICSLPVHAAPVVVSFEPGASLVDALDRPLVLAGLDTHYNDPLQRLRRLISWPLIHSLASNPTACFGTAYYVNSASGNDSNNGTSPGTPWLTGGHANAGSSYAGGGLSPNQCVFFQGTFTVCMTFATGSNILSTSALSPIVIGAYGSGATFSPASGCKISGTSSNLVGNLLIDGATSGIHGITVKNLHFVGPANGTAPFAIIVQASGGSASDTGLIIGNDITGYGTPNGNPYVGAGILFNGEPNVPASGCGALSNMTAMNNNIHGASPTASDTAGILVYTNCNSVTDSLIIGNSVTNMGSNAAQTYAAISVDGQGTQANVSGIRITSNFLNNNGGNVKTSSGGGTSGIEIHDATGDRIDHNLVMNQQAIGSGLSATTDQECIDLDLSVANTIVEDNYCYNSQGPAFTSFLDDDGAGASTGNIIRYNIAEHFLSGYGVGSWTNFYGGIGLFPIGGTGRVVSVYGNSLTSNGYTGGSASTPAVITISGGTLGAGSLIADNILASDTGGGPFFGCNTGTTTNVTIDGNDYWQINGSFNAGEGCTNLSGNSTSFAAWKTSLGQEAHGLNVSPSYSGTVPSANPCSTFDPTTGQGPAPCPPAYQLAHGSPLIGTGINPGVSPAATVDYYGDTVPNGSGSGYNIGADGAAR